MAGSYATPGVYVEEISKFPPSVAGVETAVPAFIGYTEKAVIFGTQWQFVANQVAPAQRITSMLDYEQFYGGPAHPTVGDIVLDANNNVVSAAVSYQYYMYDSLRLFFANGGGDCYIVSIGDYNTTPDPGAVGAINTGFLGGLKEIELIDEPTMLLFPDAAGMTSGTAFQDVQEAALEQCGTLKDRVAILDTLKDDVGITAANPNPGDIFRNAIPIKPNLKYGATYIPWLKTTMSGTFTYTDVKGHLKDTNGAAIDLSTLAPASLLPTLALLDGSAAESVAADAAVSNVINDATLSALYVGPVSKPTTLTALYSLLKNKYNTAHSATTFDPDAAILALQNIFRFFYLLAGQVDALVTSATPNAFQLQSQQLSGYSQLKSFLVTLTSYEKELLTELTSTNYPAATDLPNAYSQVWSPASFFPATSALNPTPSVIPLIATTSFTPTVTITVKGVIDAFASAIFGSASADGAISYLTTVAQGPDNNIATLTKALETQFPLYANIITALKSNFGEIPPSGAVAGCIAETDRDRGVWKAPANIGIAGVNGVHKKFSASQLDSLNIDVNGGKSINVIRPITGKGIMIMGSRTLAGNDNEWRYVPVRRLFNYVEESVQKSTAWAVFEPNDANTWLKVRNMIENFLYLLWRQGALAGAKPDQAYYVSCGLGYTMNAQDILEGRMNVEIGMAAVRPAEFIILKFSHKLQES